MLFRPERVWKRGRLVAEGGRPSPIASSSLPGWMRESMHVRELEPADFSVVADGAVRVIGVDAGTIVTRALVGEPLRRDGKACADPGRDLAKLAVIERHRDTGRIGVGFAQGFGLQAGALASSHAHDAHNVVVVGMTDEDMAAAANHLRAIGGGQVVVMDGRVIAELPCPIGGLLSDLTFEEVADRARVLEEAAGELGTTLPSPFMAMSFLALSVIPELKLTDRGLVDVDRFELVPLRGLKTGRSAQQRPDPVGDRGRRDPGPVAELLGRPRARHLRHGDLDHPARESPPSASAASDASPSPPSIQWSSTVTQQTGLRRPRRGASPHRSA